MKVKETCCDKPKPVGSLRILPLAFLVAFGTLAVILYVEMGIDYAFGWV